MRSRVFLSSDKSQRKVLFVALMSLFLSPHTFGQNVAPIDLSKTYQIIRGFGGANIVQWRPDMTDSEIETAFGTEDGQLGFTILRIRIQPQRNLWGTNVPTARKAYEKGAIIIASPWSPPAEMKTNNNLVGGELLEDRYEEYAFHLRDFVDLMAANGVPIFAVSVQNEPDITVNYESCDWNASQMVCFLRDYAPFIGVKVMAPESFQFRRELSDPILNDSLACANLGFVAGHIYGGGLQPYPLAAQKGKEVWMTEHLSGENSQANDWATAMDVALEINNVMHAGMSAYVWWYVVRYYGPISDGTNDSGKKGEVTKKGYVMSQFARFIRPGYYRISCPKYPQRSVWTSAYKDSASSKVVIVAINTSSEAKQQTFVFQNGHVQRFTPYVTSQTKNCHREKGVWVLANSLTVTLDPSSVTTFVSDDSTTSPVGWVPSRPAAFTLFQNYPNPFNASTRIDFIISERSFVSLRVYNLQGQTITELVGRELEAGMHSVRFDASCLSTGLYFYTLRAKGDEATRKLYVIR